MPAGVSNESLEPPTKDSRSLIGNFLKVFRGFCKIDAFSEFFIHSHVWFFHGEVTFYDSLPMTPSTRNITISSKGLSLMCFILSIHAKNFNSKFWLQNFSLEFQLRISAQNFSSEFQLRISCWIFRAEIFSSKIQLQKTGWNFQPVFCELKFRVEISAPSWKFRLGMEFRLADE